MAKNELRSHKASLRTPIIMLLSEFRWHQRDLKHTQMTIHLEVAPFGLDVA